MQDLFIKLVKNIQFKHDILNYELTWHDLFNTYNLNLFKFYLHYILLT